MSTVWVKLNYLAQLIDETMQGMSHTAQDMIFHVCSAELGTMIIHNCVFPSLTGGTSHPVCMGPWISHKIQKIVSILSILHRVYIKFWTHFDCTGILGYHWANEGRDTLYVSTTLTNEPLTLWVLNQNLCKHFKHSYEAQRESSRFLNGTC